MIEEDSEKESSVIEDVEYYENVSLFKSKLLRDTKRPNDEDNLRNEDEIEINLLD